jgi:hypothetical protein
VFADVVSLRGGPSVPHTLSDAEALDQIRSGELIKFIQCVRVGDTVLGGYGIDLLDCDCREVNVHFVADFAIALVRQLHDGAAEVVIYCFHNLLIEQFVEKCVSSSSHY